mmetsp:Transcript_23162/g.38167  ORF Transcript_23162/g.38167 Transcript_23162/m.38167 type:complete len:89 (+) Transcript_23162:986-1252(+)
MYCNLYSFSAPMESSSTFELAKFDMIRSCDKVKQPIMNITNLWLKLRAEGVLAEEEERGDVVSLIFVLWLHTMGRLADRYRPSSIASS